MKISKRKNFTVFISLIIICLISTVIGFKSNTGKVPKAGDTNTSSTNTGSINEDLQQISVDKQEIVNQEVNQAMATINIPKEDVNTEKKVEAQSPVVQAPVNKVVTAASVKDGSKVAYLTFDDGPSPKVTPLVLDVLRKENVKATFFVIGSMAEKYPNLLKQEKNEGNSIGNHTYSHNYNVVYSGKEGFLNDFQKGDKVITSIIGDYNRKLIRFPGGSFNRQQYRQYAQNAGYSYVDWNCLTGDAEVSLASTDRLMSRFNATFSNQKQLIILMHDALGKSTTPQVLPQIIEYLKAKGYTFKTF